MANRKRQSTPAFEAEQARRCGIEGTPSYDVRTCGMRRTRYSEDFTRVLARCLTTILPAMRLAEALETTRIHRVAGLTGARTALVTSSPFRAPHHTISAVGLIGGGHVPRPSEGSLAHHGILFLDELPEFRRHVLEVLHQPLEESLTYI